MLTIDALKEWGADTADGLTRCLNNEALYLRLVGIGMADPHFDALDAAIASGNTKEAFEAAHALKGVLANLSLTSLSRPVSELTEALRGKNEQVDTGQLIQEIHEQLAKLRELNR